ncbi:RNA polymerase sigma factor [Streptomyces sp. NPDC088197]|uniref:RNA polymerase sigma factor n=1 Tax=unclassified Streptomyces TaxID=2593676 RepID=UPI0033B4AA19
MTPEERETGQHTEHYEMLVSFALGHVRDRAQAEDVAHETLLRAWLHLGRIEPGSATVRAYLLTIARNLLAVTPGAGSPPNSR